LTFRLCAETGDVRRLFLRQGFVLTLTGLELGIGRCELAGEDDLGGESLSDVTWRELSSFSLPI
jgi:hypothetical protein